MNEQMEILRPQHHQHGGHRGPPASIEWKQQGEANSMAEKNARELNMCMATNRKDVEEEHPFEFTMELRGLGNVRKKRCEQGTRV